MKAFEAQKGKRIYCITGDIFFIDSIYKTDKKEEIEALDRCLDVKEVKSKTVKADIQGDYEFEGKVYKTEAAMKGAMTKAAKKEEVKEKTE